MDAASTPNATSKPTNVQGQESDIQVIQALDTIKCLETTICPHVYDFDIADGAIKKASAPFSKLASIFFSSLFDLLSPEKKEELQKRKHIIHQTLSKSMKILQLYTTKIPSSDAEKQLSDQVINTIEHYNRQHKATKDTLSHKIKNFFCKISDLSLDELSSHIPINAFYQTHKITPTDADTTAVKISHLAPKSQVADTIDPLTQQETELFMMKATTLLLQHDIISQKEIAKALALLRLKRPCAYHENLNSQKQVTLHTTLHFLPGEEISIYGTFARDSEKMRTTPIQNTFQLHCESLQSGFPHHLQTTGFNFGPKILSSFTLSSIFAHNNELKLFFNEKQKLAKALLPKGELNKRAKALFSIKKMVIERNRTHLGILLKQLMQAIMEQNIDCLFDPLIQQEDAFFTIAHVHHALIQHMFTLPHTSCDDNSLNFGFTKVDVRSYATALETKILRYKPMLLKLFSSGIVELQDTSFVEKIIRSSIRQQLAFIKECALDPLDTQIEEKLLQHLHTLFQAEIADFSGNLLHSAEDSQIYKLSQALINTCV